MKKNKINKTIFCFAYPSDLDEAYAFYCARYKDIDYEEFLNLGLLQFKKKLSSIPESEPLYNIIKSRTINVAKIKDKEERKYWRNMKKQNRIPQLYLSDNEINSTIKEKIGNGKGIM